MTAQQYGYHMDGKVTTDNHWVTVWTIRLVSLDGIQENARNERTQAGIRAICTGVLTHLVTDHVALDDIRLSCLKIVMFG
jgi:hypothetical protein